MPHIATLLGCTEWHACTYTLHLNARFNLAFECNFKNALSHISALYRPIPKMAAI